VKEFCWDTGIEFSETHEFDTSPGKSGKKLGSPFVSDNTQSGFSEELYY